MTTKLKGASYMSAATAPTTAPPSSLSHRRVLLIIGGLLLGMLLASLDQTIVSTALPTIVGDLGGLAQLSWVVTAYLLASTASTPLWGKLGDLYGRKRLFQGAIVIFLIGSVLSGISQNMIELIVFRALQGLGGGGLIVTAQALIADVVAPRERGRYQGLFGAVFGVTSVVGPLLGGFFVDNLSWRWVFYINLPVGALALVVTALVLPASGPRGHPRIDYLGTALLAGAAVSLVLLTSLGGTTYPWLSAPIIILAVAGVALVVGFVFVERRAAEPVLPLPLFRNRVFAVASAIGFVVGFAMFGSITYLPLFLQVVKGVSPTSSGLRLLPLMAGLLVTSIGSGQLITRWGHYKVFPIVGTAVFSVGLFLLSRMDEHTGAVSMSISMLVLGLGLGLVMQVLVIAVQNAVDYRDLGVATSGATFFRSIGSSFGVAIFGAIFSNELTGNLRRFLLASALPPGFNPTTARSNPAALQRLPPAAHAGYIHAYAASLQPVFLIAGVIGVVAFALTWFLREVPLRTTSQATDTGHTYAMPAARTSREEIERALGVLAGRESRGRVYERIAARAGFKLDPPSCWLLFRIDQDAPATLESLSARLRVPTATLIPVLDRLTQAGFVAVARADGDGRAATGQLALTPGGQQARDRLVTARREGLTDLFKGWSPDQQRELADVLGHLARGLLDDPGDRLPLGAPQAPVASRHAIR